MRSLNKNLRAPSMPYPKKPYLLKSGRIRARKIRPVLPSALAGVGTINEGLTEFFQLFFQSLNGFFEILERVPRGIDFRFFRFGLLIEAIQ